MAEQVNIASLTIDVDDVIKESGKLKRQIDTLKAAQKDLDKTTEDGSEAFAQNEIQIKKLSKAYKDNQMFATALDEANEDLTKTMQIEGKSTQELRDSRRQLNQISKNIIGDTEEEVQLRDQLNKTIDDQTAALRDQSSEFNSGKDQIGEYTDGINRSDLSLRGFVEKSQEAGGASKLFANSAKGAISGVKSLTKASLRFIATPIGAIIAAIAAVFLLVKNAMNRNEDASNKLKVAFSAFSGVLKGVLKLLEPIGKFLIDGIVKGFELVEKTVTKTLDLLQKALERLGLEKAAAGLEEFNEKVEEAAQANRRLVESEFELQKAQRSSRLIQLQFQKEAEKLRQVRDDENRSIQERIKANKELGALLKKQSAEELAIARKALEVAELRIELDGASTENLDARADALVEIADIEERITGQESEQLTNRVSLQKEAAEKIQEIKDQEAEAAEEAAKRKMEADKEAAEAAVELAKFELDNYVRANKSKLDSDKFLTEESAREEERRIQALADKRAEFAKEEFDNGKKNLIEYNSALAEIEEETNNSIAEIRGARSEAEKARIAEDAQNSLTILQEGLNSAFEVERIALENSKQAELEKAESTGADVNLINEKYAQRNIQLENAVTNAKIDGFGQVFDSYADILGEETKAGKAAAVASTLINTYQSAQNAYTSLSGIPVVGVGLGIAAAGAAVIAGLKNVQKIRNTNTQFSRGALLRGKSHSQGGIPFSIGGRLGYEAEGGEAILNKKSTSMFAPILSAMNVAGGGVAFANGGMLGAPSSPSSSLIDYNLLAETVAKAYAALPSPVVSVEEINTVNSTVTAVENLASS